MTTDPRDIIRRPILTEKALALQDDYNQYIFEVSRRATKKAVKHAVETVFGVEVESVKIINVKPKPRRTRSRRGMGRTRSWKKAVVRLKQGQSIPEVQGG